MIEVQDLSKTFRVPQKDPGLTGALKGLFSQRYRDVHAVQKISFSIKEGELVGFLGPNGAGKTTTLKMLSGLLHPTSGSAEVLGHIPWKRARAISNAVHHGDGPAHASSGGIPFPPGILSC